MEKQSQNNDQIGKANAGTIDEAKNKSGNDNADAKVETITRDQLSERMKKNDGVQVVNVLSPANYGKGFIKGSKKIPLDELDSRMSELDKTKDVVTYCASSECSASTKAAQKLAANGFKVKAYEGGIKEWSEADLPTDK